MEIIAVVLIAIATLGAIGITVGTIIQSVQGFCPGDIGLGGDDSDTVNRVMILTVT